MFIRTVQKEALKMAKIGYARVSSREQHLDRQLTALKNVDKLFMMTAFPFTPFGIKFYPIKRRN